MSTIRQTQLLDFIKSYMASHNGSSPSYEEMKDALGLLSKSGVHRLLDALLEQGLVRRLPNRARSIQVVEPDQIKATALLNEIIDHWYLFGAEGLDPLILRARAAAAAMA